MLRIIILPLERTDLVPNACGPTLVLIVGDRPLGDKLDSRIGYVVAEKVLLAEMSS